MDCNCRGFWLVAINRWIPDSTIGAIGIAEHFECARGRDWLDAGGRGTLFQTIYIGDCSIRRHADVAVGNILGSNIFNLLGILGVSALLQPLPVHARILQFDQWVMLGTSLLLLLLLYTGRRLSRRKAECFVVGYGIYVWLSFAVFGG